ncbi:hypothetical protein [Vineibacter terrae]|uniref:hypothetical protein n=1 Tax=Vineibacter terrae TaxID=2586908 RepID=UPI002E2EAE43|nr:hypothetical protein [Vineibacter terrae]HEX2888090.1 hypothetical protein [Vineibacter terrae]
MLTWLIGTGTGRLVLSGVAVAIMVVGAIAWIYGQGEAAGAAGVTAATLAETARRAQAAARARANLDQRPEATQHDPYNRDR